MNALCAKWTAINHATNPEHFCKSNLNMFSYLLTCKIATKWTTQFVKMKRIFASFSVAYNYHWEIHIFSKHKLSISRATEHRMCSYNIVKAFHQIHCINSFEVTFKTRNGTCVSDLMWQVLYIYTKL